MEITQLDTTSNNCISNSLVQLDWIMYKKVIEATGCNLPWVQYRNQSKENCQTETEFESYLNATKNLQAEIRDIKKPCKENVWTVINLFEERDWEHPRTEYETTFLGQDLRIMIEEEEYLYSFNDFIESSPIHAHPIHADRFMPAYSCPIVSCQVLFMPSTIHAQ